LVITTTLATFLVFMGAATGFFLYQKGRFFTGTRRSRATASEYPVEHGSVVRPEELHGHGKLYFVPVGRQVIPVESLAEYYRQKFQIQITVLPKVEIGPAACVPARRQCVAEELESAMTTAYPEITGNPSSVMIALTDEDMFPKELGWKFTYSLHSARIGIVSTRRMDPAFWGDPVNAAERLASTKQMLTKYVALMYFHVPDSFDPTSIMYTPLAPNGGSDDLYESDLHSEESVNGRRGKPSPCLAFTYSYKTHKIGVEEPPLADCQYHNPVESREQEIFETNLGWGNFIQRSMDFTVESSPAIEFRRGYNSGYWLPSPLGMGWGGSHSYNASLTSDGVASLTVINIAHEDGYEYNLPRVGRGRGFDPAAVYESRDDEIWGARLTWQSDHYKVQYRDGAWSTFLPCTGSRTHCYWTGYQDGKGNTLQFDRGPAQELRQLTTSDHQGISFQSDDKHQIIEAMATNGAHVSYEYDAAGCLARVHRTDGQVTLYEYDPNHRMTSVSVIQKRGGPPETVLTNEYDSQGRVVKQTVAGVGTYSVQYVVIRDKYAYELKVTDPAGRVLRITLGDGDDNYVARTTPIRFMAARRP
jgi:YD repeat-containing protein